MAAGQHKISNMTKIAQLTRLVFEWTSEEAALEVEETNGEKTGLT
jgi:hypothetical protein